MVLVANDDWRVETPRFTCSHTVLRQVLSLGIRPRPLEHHQPAILAPRLGTTPLVRPSSRDYYQHYYR